MNRDVIRQLAELLRRIDEVRHQGGDDEGRNVTRVLRQGDAIVDALPFDVTGYPIGDEYDYEAGLEAYLGGAATDAYVFVYGTLKRGEFNHRLLRGATYMGDATVEGYSLTAGRGFPYAIPVVDGRARGEAYRVDSTTMARLDGLEGFPYHYTRDYIEVSVDGPGPVRAWIYVANDDIQKMVLREEWELVEEWRDEFVRVTDA